MKTETAELLARLPLVLVLVAVMIVMMISILLCVRSVSTIRKKYFLTLLADCCKR
jgi:hypothetical protein